MSTRYEYYNTGDDWNESVLGAIWYTQTFTPQVPYTFNLVKLKLWRSLWPGYGYIKLRATSGGVPTGPDLFSVGYNWNGVTSSSPGIWYSISLGAGYLVAASTMYALILCAPSGDYSNCLYWRADQTGAYSRGAGHESRDSGVTWLGSVGHDEMFETWGDPAGAKLYSGGIAAAKRLMPMRGW